MGVQISAFFAPTRATPEHIALAEELGFARAWCYDSPLLYDDVFVTLARAAERTSRIGLGVGVLVPGLRAPVVTASALTSIAALAPGRVAVAVGAGFTGRFTLGLPPVRMARLEAEVAELRTLLGGGEVGHQEGGAPVRLIRVPGADGPWPIPIYISCRGPRAQALAREAGDGAMTGIFYPGGLGLVRAGVGDRIPLVVHAVGAVREDDEPWDSERLKAAVGPVVAVAFHQFAEQPWRLEGLDPELRASAEAYGFKRRARGLALGAKAVGIERFRNASPRAIQHGIAAEPDHDVVETGQPLEHCRMLECARHTEANASLDRHVVERNAGKNYAPALRRDKAGHEIE